MSPFTFRTRRLSIRADLSPGADKALRRVKRTINTLSRSAKPSDNGPAIPRLVVPKNTPEVTPRPRDPDKAVAYFRDIRVHVGDQEEQAQAATLPSNWGREELSHAVASTWWYHTIELPHGIATPGAYDHRLLLPHYDLPNDLKGARVLDVATFDGYWAFEFERLGAEVVATDIPMVHDLDLPFQVRDRLVEAGADWRTGTAFRIAHQALSSRVSRVECSVYDLDPDTLGNFDLVHVSDLLLHLRDPIAALRAVARVTGDRAIITDCFDPEVPAGLSRYEGGWSVATWWLPSLETLAQMVSDAGFRDVSVRRTFQLGTEAAPGPWRVSLLATK